MNVNIKKPIKFLICMNKNNFLTGKSNILLSSFLRTYIVESMYFCDTFFFFNILMPKG